MVPEEIGRDGIASHRLRHPDPVAPVFLRYSCGVHLTADYLERFAVEKKFFACQGTNVVLTVLSLNC